MGDLSPDYVVTDYGTRLSVSRSRLWSPRMKWFSLRRHVTEGGVSGFPQKTWALWVGPFCVQRIPWWRSVNPASTPSVEEGDREH